MKKLISFSCFACLIVSIIFTGQSMAATFCVSNEANLIAALNEAKANGSDDVIKIQQGTYNGNFVYASAEPFGLTIEGGYTAVCASRLVDPKNTILDGGAAGPVLVLSSPDKPAIFVVEGITLQNGKTGHVGGGLFVLYEDGSINVKDSNILHNESISHGGGIYISGDGNIVNITNSYISFNKTDGTGGGIGLSTNINKVSINNSDIAGNEAKRYGGGIQINHANDFLLTNSRISNNSAEYGGGLNLDAYHPGVNNSITISNNLLSSVDPR